MTAPLTDERRASIHANLLETIDRKRNKIFISLCGHMAANEAQMLLDLSRPQRNAVLVRRETLESVAEAFKGYDDNDGLDFISSENIGEDADLTVGDIRRALKSTTPPGGAVEHRENCELKTQSPYGLCTCDFDERMRASTTPAAGTPQTNVCAQCYAGSASYKTESVINTHDDEFIQKGVMVHFVGGDIIPCTATPPQAPGDALTSSMDNVFAMTLGKIALEVGAQNHPGVGDSIDRGLILRRRLEEEGFSLRRMRAQG